MSASLKEESVNCAWITGADVALVQSSDIKTTLIRLGFTPVTNTAEAPVEPRRVGLILTYLSSGKFEGPSTPSGTALPAEVLRIAVTSSDARTAAAGFHAVLALPVDECSLVEALAACRYVAISVRERESLHARIRELTCDDNAVARHFLRLLIDTNRSTLAELLEAFSTSSWGTVGSGAHRMAGSARMLDCMGLLALLSRLEEAACTHQAALARAILQVIANTLNSLDVSLQQLLDAA
ncbi:HPt (histidine-containing phosphotransfer) domain-containing protein [Paraburkholderia sp. GAS38]|uniref:Hpt domain-containing protein n=1 Tax=Paraburkholderia sp. GAS38 TaxID=3035133 RepID=UPI003D1FA065